MNKILAISAHSDDLIIGLGGTISKLASLGYEVHALSVCNDRIEGFNKALTFLGAKPLTFNYEYSKVDENSLINNLENLFNKIKPNTIFTHWENEILYDHYVVSEISIKIARKYEANILQYEIPATSVNFEFNVAIDIENNYFKKIKAMLMMKNAFSNEVFKNEIYPSVIYTPPFRGIQVGVKYAEVFKNLGNRFPLSPYHYMLIDFNRKE
ncbi:MAG: hypothetical protein PWQ85_623 [Geotoga sp.]|jgi:LmbE family N-acetylglucosaminyl deacetylase|nr:hypothetical protein [Geotoga sp.]